MDLLIIDDHALFASGLKELLSIEEPSWRIEIANSRGNAIQKLQNAPCKLALVDLDLGGECGIALTAELTNRFPTLSVSILSANESLPSMKASIENGAIGYICKSSDPEDFVRAIRLLLKDGSFFPAPLLPHLLEQTQPRKHRHDQEAHSRLTPRQAQIMELLVCGKSNKVIAYDLGITEGTVKLHVSAILDKLQLSSRAEIMATFHQSA